MIPSKINDKPNTCRLPSFSLKKSQATSVVDTIKPEDATGNAIDNGKDRNIITQRAAPDA
jgi:hypothetical protein